MWEGAHWGLIEILAPVWERWGPVWCGVVWYGVAWCGVVWCGVVWCGVVWCGVVWSPSILPVMPAPTILYAKWVSFAPVPMWEC